MFHLSFKLYPIVIKLFSNKQFDRLFETWIVETLIGRAQFCYGDSIQHQIKSITIDADLF